MSLAGLLRISGRQYGHGLVRGNCYPLACLSVSVFSIVDSDDVEDLLFWVYNAEEPEISYSIAPGFGGIPLKLLDIFTPEGLILELWIDKGIKFPPQEGGVARRQLLEALQELVGFEYAEFRQTGLAWPSRREGRS